jgi:hypothetical protein
LPIYGITVVRDGQSFLYVDSISPEMNFE